MAIKYSNDGPLTALHDDNGFVCYVDNMNNARRIQIALEIHDRIEQAGAIRQAINALNGDSNDAEHDALYDLLEAVNPHVMTQINKDD